MASRSLLPVSKRFYKQLYIPSHPPLRLPARSSHFSALSLFRVTPRSVDADPIVNMLEETSQGPEAELEESSKPPELLEGRKCLARHQVVESDEKERRRADEKRRAKLAEKLYECERRVDSAENEVNDAYSKLRWLEREKERLGTWERVSGVEDSSELVHEQLSEHAEATLSILARRTGLSRQEILLGMIWLAPSAYYPRDSPEPYLDEWFGPLGGLAEGPTILQGFRIALADSDWTSLALLHTLWWTVLDWMLPSRSTDDDVIDREAAPPFRARKKRTSSIMHLLEKERGADGEYIVKRKKEGWGSSR
ncbi:hypothetical protein BCR35DRAFT_302931 [Leucosporidium creatinivorum]|uniref:Uncharacterized protein n=1 Tax=Leucosporidium creatinivorum TaxID=106004 RepID=A0A1Y2FMQ4_9BASI|nr:hypothetical protein BCR35DRAFT_302931 [Leucosporidium creatinivorum]